MKRSAGDLVRHRVLPLVGLVVFGAGLWVLHRELGLHSIREVLAHFGGYAPSLVLAAVALTAANFVVLTGYDALAVRAAGRSLPYRRTGLASFLNYSFSQALGFPLLTGAPLRLRLYSAWGFSAVEVARIVAFSLLTFWLGFCTLAGLVLVLEPRVVAQLASLPPAAVRVGALALLAVPAAYLVWTVALRRPLRFRSAELARPSTATSLAQVVLGTLDWFLSASVLYVLLPPGHGLGLLGFAAVYLAAQVVGLVSMVPGGIGVFEAMILVTMPGTGAEDALLASVLAFRLIFHMLPLLTAAAVLGAYEMRERRRGIVLAADLFGKGISAAAPLVLSATVFAAGAVLLFSGSLPIPFDYLEGLGRLVPLELIEFSHFLGSVVGALLLVVAWGLFRRLDGAYQTTLVLLGLAMFGSVARGGALLHVVGLGVVLIALVGARREFFRKTSFTSEPFSLQWTTLVLGVLIATVWLGLFAHRFVEYSDDLWWRFALMADAPRTLRSMVGAVGAIALFAGVRLLAPARQRSIVLAPGDAGEDVDAVVRTASRASANLVYLGDKTILLSESRRSLIMYAVAGRSWVSMGDPVGRESEFAELVWRFREKVRRSGGWPVFYQVAPAHLSLYVDVGLSFVKLGEEARVPLESFSLEGSGRAGLRKAVRRIERTGATFEVLPPEEVPASLGELRLISDGWLERKGVQEKGFSLGFFSEASLVKTPVALVRLAGRPVAFANVWTGEGGREASADLMRYAADAPSGVMDFLFARLMLWAAEGGYRHFSLGMAPLGGLEAGPMAPLWSRLGATVFRHGEHFYNFQGLRAYKDKFEPVWEPRYLASPGRMALPRVLASVASLISRGGPA